MSWTVLQRGAIMLIHKGTLFLVIAKSTGWSSVLTEVNSPVNSSVVLFYFSTDKASKIHGKKIQEKKNVAGK